MAIRPISTMSFTDALTELHTARKDIIANAHTISERGCIIDKQGCIIDKQSHTIARQSQTINRQAHMINKQLVAIDKLHEQLNAYIAINNEYDWKGNPIPPRS